MMQSPPLKNENFESQDSHEANIQNFTSQNQLEGSTTHPLTSLQSNWDQENITTHDLQNEKFLMDQQNSEIQHKNQESWERMDKINRMLEEHRRKKTASVTRSPLPKIDDNSNIQEEEKPFENVIKLYPVQNTTSSNHSN